MQLIIKDQNLIETIIALAKKELVDGDDLICDIVGSNVDDAYALGINDGQASLAKQIVQSKDLVQIEE